MSRLVSVVLVVLAAAAAASHVLAQGPAPASGTMLVYIGTYTNPGKSKGIYVSRLDTTNGHAVAG